MELNLSNVKDRAVIRKTLLSKISKAGLSKTYRFIEQVNSICHNTENFDKTARFLMTMKDFPHDTEDKLIKLEDLV